MDRIKGDREKGREKGEKGREKGERKREKGEGKGERERERRKGEGDGRRVPPVRPLLNVYLFTFYHTCCFNQITTV